MEVCGLECSKCALAPAFKNKRRVGECEAGSVIQMQSGCVVFSYIWGAIAQCCIKDLLNKGHVPRCRGNLSYRRLQLRVTHQL